MLPDSYREPRIAGFKQSEFTAGNWLLKKPKTNNAVATNPVYPSLS